MTTQEKERKQQEQSGASTEKKTTAKSKKAKKKRTGGEKALAAIAKWVFISFCLLFSVIFGLVVGYSILGDGRISDVFDMGTWKHLYNLVFSS